MNKDTLLNLIKNPANISTDEAEMLEEVVRQNPYFQVGHLLIAKYQHTQKSTLATQKIRKASLYSYNRSRLKTFLDVVSSTENDNPQTFKTTSKDAKVFFENIQNEISDFDKKFSEADPEIITKELEKSYQTDNYKLEISKEEDKLLRQTENQKEQNDLIDAFLNKADTPKQTEKNTDSEVENISENVAEDVTESVVESISENSTENSTQTSVNEVVDAFVVTPDVMPDITPDVTPSIIHEPTPTYEPTPTHEPTRVYEPVSEDNDGEEVTEIQAITLYASGKNKEAVAIYKKLLKINPDKTDYYESQIEILSDFSDEARIETTETKEETSFETRNLNNASFDNFDTTPTEVVREVFTEKIVTETPKEIITETFGDRKEVIREIEEVKIPEISRIPEIKISEKISEKFFEKIEEKKIEVVTPKITEKTAPDSSNGQLLHEDVALKLLDEGRMDEAVEVYKKLILQNPEKKAYFVTQIEILEN